jgi:hypothetical protein
MENHHAIKFGKQLFLWAIYIMAMLVITRGYLKTPYVASLQSLWIQPLCRKEADTMPSAIVLTSPESTNKKSAAGAIVPPKKYGI